MIEIISTDLISSLGKIVQSAATYDSLSQTLNKLSSHYQVSSAYQNVPKNCVPKYVVLW